jgi:hypothetical protein
MVYKMSLEDPGSASFAGIGGLNEQVRELREVRPRRFCPTTRAIIYTASLRSSSFLFSTPSSSNA